MEDMAGNKIPKGYANPDPGPVLGAPFGADHSKHDVRERFHEIMKEELGPNGRSTDTDDFCRALLKLLGIEEYRSFDMANMVAQFAMDCENEGREFQRKLDEVKTLEFKTGFIPDRRKEK